MSVSCLPFATEGKLVNVHWAAIWIVVLLLNWPVTVVAQEQAQPTGNVVYGDVYSDSYPSTILHPYYGGPTNPFYSGPDPLKSEDFVRRWQGYTDNFVDSGWYISGIAGFQFLEEQTSHGSPNRRDDAKFNGGPAAGAGVGYRIGRYRYEAAFEYRSNTVDSLRFNGNPFVTRGFSRTYAVQVITAGWPVVSATTTRLLRWRLI